jgi:hypothetical protein
MPDHWKTPITGHQQRCRVLAPHRHSNKFLDPVRDGVVLPILHLNCYKIANPTVLDDRAAHIQGLDRPARDGDADPSVTS